MEAFEGAIISPGGYIGTSKVAPFAPSTIIDFFW